MKLILDEVRKSTNQQLNDIKLQLDESAPNPDYTIFSDKYKNQIKQLVDVVEKTKQPSMVDITKTIHRLASSPDYPVFTIEYNAMTTKQRIELAVRTYNIVRCDEVVNFFVDHREKPSSINSWSF